jgi:hypothetical protein
MDVLTTSVGLYHKHFQFIKCSLLYLFIFRTFLYLVFVLVLGSTCERATLLTDFMIAAKVSAVRKYRMLGDKFRV